MRARVCVRVRAYKKRCLRKCRRAGNEQVIPRLQDGRRSGLSEENYDKRENAEGEAERRGPGKLVHQRRESRRAFFDKRVYAPERGSRLFPPPPPPPPPRPLLAKSRRPDEKLKRPCFLQFKDEVAKKFNAQPDQMCLIFAGKIMKDNETLGTHHVDKDGLTVHLVIKSPRAPGSQNNQSEEQESRPRPPGIIDLGVVAW